MVLFWLSLLVVAAVWVGVYVWLERRDKRSLRKYLKEKHPSVVWQSSTGPIDLDDTSPAPFDELQREGRRANGR